MGCFDLLHSAIKINPILLGRNLEDVVKPNIAFLQQCGLTASNVPEFAMLICMKPEDVKERVACAEKLGVPRSAIQGCSRAPCGLSVALVPTPLVQKWMS